MARIASFQRPASAYICRSPPKRSDRSGHEDLSQPDQTVPDLGIDDPSHAVSADAFMLTRAEPQQ